MTPLHICNFYHFVRKGNRGTQLSKLRDRLNENEFDWNAAVISITKDKTISEVNALLLSKESHCC